MVQFQSQSIPQEKFLLMAVNLLHRTFIESARTDAKNVYKELAAPRAVSLTTVQMEDKSTVRFGLSLEHSEFQGKLNYGAFRASLAALIANITQVLRDEREITVFNSGEDASTLIFGITAVTVEEDMPNVMVLGADTGGRGAEVMLRLMYLDPEQFSEQQTAGTSGEDPSNP